MVGDGDRQKIDWILSVIRCTKHSKYDQEFSNGSLCFPIPFVKYQIIAHLKRGNGGGVLSISSFIGKLKIIKEDLQKKTL